MFEFQLGWGHLHPDSSPSPSSVIGVPLSPVLPPILSATPSPPFHTRPATPWPHATSNPSASSPPSSPLSAINFPPLSPASHRRHSWQRPGSPSPSVNPLAPAAPFPTPSSPPSSTVNHNLGSQIPSSLSPPPLLVSIDLGVAAADSVGPFSPSAPPCHAGSLPGVEMPCFQSPDAVRIGDVCLSNHIPCPVGPSSGSPGSPAELLLGSGGSLPAAVQFTPLF